MGMLYEYDSIEQEIINRAGKQMAEEIDFGILADLLKEIGWVEIEFEPHVESILSYEIQNWIRNNCKGLFRSRGKRFLFELEKDASWFLLKWGS
jgi:hypothetical protein